MSTAKHSHIRAGTPVNCSRLRSFHPLYAYYVFMTDMYCWPDTCKTEHFELIHFYPPQDPETRYMVHLVRVKRTDVKKFEDWCQLLVDVQMSVYGKVALDLGLFNWRITPTGGVEWI